MENAYVNYEGTTSAQDTVFYCFHGQQSSFIILQLYRKASGGNHQCHIMLQLNIKANGGNHQCQVKIALQYTLDITVIILVCYKYIIFFKVDYG